MKKLVIATFTLIAFTTQIFGQEYKIKNIVRKEAELPYDVKLKVYSFNFAENKDIYFVFDIDPSYNCHACGSKFSIFFTDKQGNILDYYIHIGEFGAWGQPPNQDDIKVYNINGTPFIIIKGGYVQTGTVMESLTAFRLYNGKLENLGTIMTAVDNSGMVFENTDQLISWSADYFILEQKNDYPKILLNIEGIKNGKKFNKVETYYFNGKEYVLEK